MTKTEHTMVLHTNIIIVTKRREKKNQQFN